MAKFNAAWRLGKLQFRQMTGVEPETFRAMAARLAAGCPPERIEQIKNLQTYVAHNLQTK